MFEYFGPQVVIIDDKPEEIIGIKRSLCDRGIGCKYFNADTANGDTRPEKTLSNVKIVFLDLFYNSEAPEFDVEQVASWIDSIIPEKTFYLLIIWSKDTDQIEKIIEELKNVRKDPLLYLSKTKTEYRKEESFNFIKLIDDIEEEIENNPAIHELLAWRQGAINTADHVIGTICEDKSELKLKLQKFIYAHGGKVFENANPDIKRNILYDALDDVLATRSNEYRYLNEIDEKIKSFYNEATGTFEVDSELNSWFIFEKNPLKDKLFHSGCIFKCNDTQLEHFLFSKSKIFTEYLNNLGNNNKPDVIDLMMIINPACNLAQGKIGAGYKFIAGIFGDLSNSFIKNRSEAFKDIKNIKLFGKSGTLLFDATYVFTLPKIKIEEYDIEPVAQLTKHVFNDIQNFYSAHSSRIGFTYLTK